MKTNTETPVVPADPLVAAVRADKSHDLKVRTKAFAVRVIRLVNWLPHNRAVT